MVFLLGPRKKLLTQEDELATLAAITFRAGFGTTSCPVFILPALTEQVINPAGSVVAESRLFQVWRRYGSQ